MEGLSERVVFNNDYAPTASSFGYYVNHDQVLQFDIQSMSMASDMDGDILSFALAEGSTPRGLVSIGGTSVTYTPPEAWAGTDTFKFTVSDGVHTTDEYTATIDVVNHAPSGSSFSYFVNHDQTLNLDLRGMAMVSDMEGDEPIFTLVGGQPDDATVILASNGELTLIPRADWAGTVSFEFMIDDGVEDDSGLMTSGPFTATIDVVNHPPSGSSFNYFVTHDQTLNLDLRGMAMVSDMEGDDPVFALVGDQPEHASVSLTAEGQLTLIPEAHWAGFVSFQYLIHDNVEQNGELMTSGPFTATIEVTDYAPSGSDIEKTIMEGELLSFNVKSDGMATDMDGDELAAILISSPENAAPNGFTFNANGDVSFRPKSDWYGTTTFQFKLGDGVFRDGEQVTSPAYTVTINVTPKPRYTVSMSVIEAVGDEDSQVPARIRIQLNEVAAVPVVIGLHYFKIGTWGDDESLSSERRDLSLARKDYFYADTSDFSSAVTEVTISGTDHVDLDLVPNDDALVEANEWLDVELALDFDPTLPYKISAGESTWGSVKVLDNEWRFVKGDDANYRVSEATGTLESRAEIVGQVENQGVAWGYGLFSGLAYVMMDGFDGVYGHSDSGVDWTFIAEVKANRWAHLRYRVDPQSGDIVRVDGQILTGPRVDGAATADIGYKWQVSTFGADEKQVNVTYELAFGYSTSITVTVGTPDDFPHISFSAPLENSIQRGPFEIQKSLIARRRVTDDNTGLEMINRPF